MEIVKKFIAILFCACIIAFMLSFAISASAANLSLSFKDESYTQKAEIYKNPNGRIMSISRKGDWRNYPENSLVAIMSASQKGADIIEIDIKKTSDGIFILLEDDTLSRTTNYGDTANVNSLTYDEIASYKLREKQGGATADATTYTVPSLNNALMLNINSLLLLDFDWELRNEIYAEVKSHNMLDRVIFLTRTTASTAAKWIESLAEKPMTLGYHKGNIVFRATGYIDKHLEAGGNGVWLATNNPYGYNFQEIVLNNFDGKGRAAASPATPDICGKKTDTEIWWNDLVNRGFSLIITDYPEELAQYIQKSINAMDRLIELRANTTKTFSLPNFTADIFTEYKRNYDKAIENADALIAQGFAGEQNLLSAYTDLCNAVDNIELNFAELANGKSGLTITPVRIIVAILAVAAVISAQIYTHRKMSRRK